MKFLRRYNPHRSIFFHIVIVLIIITVLINITVFAFFHISGPPLKSHWIRHLERYSNYIATEMGDPPSEQKAILLASELKMEISFLNHEKHWTTSKKIPPLEKLKAELIQNRRSKTGSAQIGHYGSGFFKIHETGSGTFIFWIERPEWISRSTRQIIGLLIFFSLVLFLAGWVFRRMLSPIKFLEKSFAEVSRGNFNIRMEITGPREFLSAANGFNSMVKQISEMISSRDRLLRDMSHEFRSPLARIKLALGMMPESEEKKSVAEDIYEMERLVTDILEAYKYAENPDSVHASNGKNLRENFNLSELLARQTDRFRKTFFDIKFLENFSDRNIIINGDKEKIRRLIGNLLENAVKHNSPGGDITISLKTDSDRQQVILEIADQGEGVAEKFREKIFDPFFRIEEARTPGTGYGLGLFICREIVHYHGGKINVRPNLPGGSVFQVTLPIGNLIKNLKAN